MTNEICLIIKPQFHIYVINIFCSSGSEFTETLHSRRQ